MEVVLRDGRMGVGTASPTMVAYMFLVILSLGGGNATSDGLAMGKEPLTTVHSHLTSVSIVKTI